MTVSTRFLARAGLMVLAVGLVAVAPEAQNRSKPTRSWEASWEARQARESERRRVESLRRAYEFRRALAHARLRSEGDVGAAMRASTPPAAEAMCPVLSDPRARQDYRRQAHKWREQAFRRSTGLQPRTGLSVFSAAKGRKPVFDGGVSPAMASTAHAVSTAVLASSASASASSVSESASSVSESAHMVPLFPSASDARGRQGFARVINHSGEAGEVSIEAFDDEGASYGPLTLSIGAGETVHFNSNDLEDGNAGKGLTGSTGPGQGDWRLELTSELDIEVLSYIRTTDGFLTAMHDTVPVGDEHHRVVIFNPGSNLNQESLLRLVNPGDADATVMIAAVDDKGLSPGEGATATIPAGASVTYAAAELESGSAAGLRGTIGDGSGKWWLVLESEERIIAMSLLSSPTGHLTNLSTAPDNEQDGTHAVPLFPSASDARGRQGFARVVNRSDESGEVMIEAFDDTDRDYEVLTLLIGANETRHFNSDDLELGNADKGLTGSTGAGDGDWRLELSSELDIEVLSYIRTTDGFLTAMHDLVPRSAKRHRVAVFNPGSNLNQQSVLWLVNPGEEPAEVTIAGFDDRDASPGSDVIVTVPAGGSASYTAAELESGSEEFEGALGNGSGKWRLTVNADRPIVAMSLLSSPTGHLTNLSTAPERGAGPVETAPESYEALISPIVQSKCVNCHVEGGASGHTPLVFVRATDADHLAKNLSVFENYLAEVEGGADRILNKIQGALAHGGGVQVSAGTEEYRGFETLMELLGADVKRPDVTVGNLFDGVTFESPRRTLWRAAIVFAGRIPTASEYSSIEGGTEDDLRRAIRGLMQGPEFHEFLIRGANDRLLTDRELDKRGLFDNYRFFVDYINKLYRLSEEAAESGAEDQAGEWGAAAEYGVARAPLELIAHVVENDLPYKDILTADYVMANPMAAEAYGAATEFADPTDAYEFKPSEIVSYYADGPDYAWEHGEFGPFVTDPGPVALDVPHVGILNTRAFLQRYPTTATNRNRARSRWTYYHFLGDDIEKSEARTMNQKVLEDTNNPTLRNEACTVCHERMDPVAGTFQLYGDEGFYRDQWAGRDSLAGFYKYPPGNVLPLEAQSWSERETLTFNRQLLEPGDGLYIDEADSNWDNSVALDNVSLVDEAGAVVFEREFEDPEAGIECPRGMEFGCGGVMRNDETGEDDHWVIELDFIMPLTVPVRGRYDIEIVAWANEPDRGLRVGVTPYRIDDTWYRDMRDPGFGRRVAPVQEDDTLSWLAQQIVQDERFATASVKFWWPAIMGSEVAEQPTDENDADFKAVQLAARSQVLEVDRLADGFRRGPHNLKDLLAEIVLSKWFRARSPAGNGEVPALALRGAGAERLLTPEELARKTANLVGYEWGRWIYDSGSPHRRGTSSLRDDDVYRLWYGGIDSDGVAERAREMTSVMAAVAKTHASAVSCPVVMREFYFWGDEDRRLFAGLGKRVSPAWEYDTAFAIEAESEDDRQTVATSAMLAAGSKDVVLSLTNEVWDEGWQRTLRLDKLVVRDAGDEAAFERVFELEELDDECGQPNDDHRALSSFCALTVTVDLPADGTYAIEVVGWGDQTNDEAVALEVVVESDTEESAGSAAIRNRLVELHRDFLGVEVDANSPDIEAAYRLFVDVWRDNVESGTGFFEGCDMYHGADIRYYTELLGPEALLEGVRSYDWDFVGDYHDGIDFSDSRGVARTWVVVLAYLLTDYRYLHL